MVNPRARRTSIGSMLNAKLSRPQLKAQAATLPPQLPPTRDWFRRNPLKRQRSPDPEKAKPAPHSSMRASSRGTRDDDSVTSGGGSPAPPLFVETNRGRLSSLARSAGLDSREVSPLRSRRADPAGPETAPQHRNPHRPPQPNAIKPKLPRAPHPT